MKAAFCGSTYPIGFRVGVHISNTTIKSSIRSSFFLNFSRHLHHYNGFRSCKYYPQSPHPKLHHFSTYNKNSIGRHQGPMMSQLQQHPDQINTRSEIEPTSSLLPENQIEKLRSEYSNVMKQSKNITDDTAALVRSMFSFDLDRFQYSALQALASDRSVVLSAPTGAGKTVVGEMAILLALCRNMRVFYTTPLKALSNQKFYDFKKQFGENSVGLLTGDVSVNRNANILVMTTEIYRNMLYAEGTGAQDLMLVTDNLHAVIFDEFHYLNDEDRGTVWEESVINSPEHVLLVALSATMSNTKDVKDWFAAVQGPTELVESNIRPVPLKFAYCDYEGVTPLFAKEEDSSSQKKGKGFGSKKKLSKKSSGPEMKLHPKLLRKIKLNSDKQKRETRNQKHNDNEDDDGRGRMKSKYQEVVSKRRSRRSDMAEVPSFPFVVRSLRRRDMLPCITFIFSRAGCDRAAHQAASEKESLVNENEIALIREKLDQFQRENPGLVQPERIELALKGIASHHAGLLPLWKLCVEELFQDGLIKVVFATETLAAGINMPARTTVISALSKRTGEDTFRALTTSEALQMAGRAGRRGKDVVGHSLVLRSRNEGALDAFKTLTANVDSLQSKFTPTYGMVLNLLSARPLEDAKKLVDRSFGNFLRTKYLQEAQANGENNSNTNNEHDERALEREALELILQEAKDILEQVDSTALGGYVKALERIKAERRALMYLEQQSSEMEAELLADTLTFAPMGTRLLLRTRLGKSTGAEKRQRRRDYSSAIEAAANGDNGASLREFYLGSGGENNDIAEAEREIDGLDEEEIDAILLDLHAEEGGTMFSAVDSNGALRIFKHTAVSRVLYDDEPIDVGSLIGETTIEEFHLPARSNWRSTTVDQYEAPLPIGLDPLKSIVEELRDKRLLDMNMKEINEADNTNRMHAGAIAAQRERVRNAQRLIRENELHEQKDIERIIAAKRAVNKIEGTLDGSTGRKEKIRKERRARKKKSNNDNERDIEIIEANGKHRSWEEFLALAGVLQHYGKVDDEYKITGLGGLAAKVRSENELWTSLVLLEPCLEEISPIHLGAILGAIQGEGFRGDVYIGREVSEEVTQVGERLAATRTRLLGIQSQFGIYTSAPLDVEGMGLVEMWAEGATWTEILGSTSLQEGDICRMMRKSLDLLRQILHLPVISDGLKLNARRAIVLMERSPVVDGRTYMAILNENQN